MLAALSANKAGIVVLLRPGDDVWNAEDWQVYYDGRAGISEFVGRLSRAQAEAQAFACCVSEWMNRNPQTSSPSHCLTCGGNDSATDPLLPFGIDTNGHAWLHSRCWDGWFKSRKEEAASVLVAMGVEYCRSIDVNRLHQGGCLRSGWAGGWQWSRDEEKTASINLRAEEDRLHLSYRVRVAGGDWEDVVETVRIVRVPCRFGGMRPYFICPGVVNGIPFCQRVVKLHGSGRYFLCRHGIIVSVPSQGHVVAHL